MKILLALDASTHSARALHFVTRMRWPAGSRVLVASVLPAGAGSFAGELDRADTEAVGYVRRHEELIANAERQLHEAGHPTESRCAEGDPREVLVRLARTEGVDLVILGSHGRTGIARLVLGSVSSHVVGHAPCSVLVVKSPEASRRAKEEPS